MNFPPSVQQSFSHLGEGKERQSLVLFEPPEGTEGTADEAVMFKKKQFKNVNCFV